MQNPLVLLLMTAAALYLAKLWRDDLRAAQMGAPNPRAFPGAAPASVRAVAIAAAGVIVLVAAETLGELRLGLTAQQSRITWLFGAYTLAAAVIEELIFRGWLVIEGRGRAALWAGVAGASLVFAALHPFLWKWDDAGFALTPTAKGWFSFAAVFAASLWFYAARFASWNPARSLLPCFAAHAMKNLAVLAVKFAQGYVAGLW
jgi:membrane protease YdiL (CAAX protease family)